LSLVTKLSGHERSLDAGMTAEIKHIYAALSYRIHLTSECCLTKHVGLCVVHIKRTTGRKVAPAVNVYVSLKQPVALRFDTDVKAAVLNRVKNRQTVGF
jgi:hypothetical protein